MKPGMKVFIRATGKRDFEVPVKMTVGHFAIHRPLVNNLDDPHGLPCVAARKWLLTHVRSGLAVYYGLSQGHFPSLRIASVVAQELSKIPGMGRMRPSKLCGRRCAAVLRRISP